MIITIQKDTDEKDVEILVTKLENDGFEIIRNKTLMYDVFAIIGETNTIDENQIKAYEFVKSVTRINDKYKLASRIFHPQDSIIDVNGIKIGYNQKIAIIAGPCCVENEEMIKDIAVNVKEMNASLLRGGAYKPRTSPYSFQGMETSGIEALVEARKITNLGIVSEIMSIEKIEEFEQNVDLIQVGARNMQNFELLKQLGKNTTKPILLKRGFSNTIEEWIMSAEYILACGNPNVILCERGIRTFETQTRNTLDLSVIPIIREKTHLPIIIDPSHACGNYRYVEAISLAAIAAGCDGLLIEVHNDPVNALSDGAQSLNYENFNNLIKKAKLVANAIGRDI